MRFLIAGFGSIGRRHLRNLLALGERDIVLYRTFQGTMPDDELAGFPVETDLEAALARAPQAVIVSNPTALHLEVAIPAAEIGCHLLLEKPISHSLDGLDRLAAAVQHGGGQVLMGYQFRFHPGLQAAAHRLQTGELGRPLAVRAHWGEHLPGWHPWEDYRQSYSAREDLGGGVVLTLSHPLDYLRWLLGEIRELWAFTADDSHLGLEVEDRAVAGLHFYNGALGSLHLDYIQRPPAHELEIVASGGTLQWRAGDGALRVYRADRGEWETLAPPPHFERNDLFLAEMRHFLAVSRGQADPVCTLQDGRRALELALAILESAQDGRRKRMEA